MNEEIDLEYIANMKVQIEQLDHKKRELRLDLQDLIHEIYSKMLNQGVNYVNCDNLINDANIVAFLRARILDK